jgi:hypothetical protein
MYPDGGAISAKRPPSVLVSSGTEKAAVDHSDPELRSCEAKLIGLIRNHWALDFGTREVRLVIEYQDNVPVLIRVTENVVKEEKLK